MAGSRSLRFNQPTPTKMNKSESIDELSAALAKAQGEMKNPKFDTANPFFKSRYASLSCVRDAVIPCLSKNNLAVTQIVQAAGESVECETVLMHGSGQWLSSTLQLPVTKHDAQGFGSAITYARRYSLMAICGVVGDEDDDGNAASAGKAGKPAEQRKEASSEPTLPKVANANTAAGIKKEENLILEEYTTLSSKPGEAKPWILHKGKFATDSGSLIECMTFDANLGKLMEKYQGQEVTISHKPGRKANSLELVSIETADYVPM